MDVPRLKRNQHSLIRSFLNANHKACFNFHSVNCTLTERGVIVGMTHSKPRSANRACAGCLPISLLQLQVYARFMSVPSKSRRISYAVLQLHDRNLPRRMTSLKGNRWALKQGYLKETRLPSTFKVSSCVGISFLFWLAAHVLEILTLPTANLG